MKTEMILNKSWFQMPTEGYDNRFDEFSTFFWKGVGYIILFLFWARSDFGQKSGFRDKKYRDGSPQGPTGSYSTLRD